MAKVVDLLIVNRLFLVQRICCKIHGEDIVRRVEMVRLEQGDQGTFGVLRLDGKVFCVTLEPPDNGNMENVSCIPEGVYTCRRVESPAFGNTFEITDVPGRSHILFHAGNVSNDTRGCVLLGRQFGQLGSDRAVLRSGDAVRAFLEQCSGMESFPLQIVSGYEVR